MSRLLLLADLHLGGAPSRSPADVERASDWAARLRAAVIAELGGAPGHDGAAAHTASPIDAVLVAGDLFDRDDSSDRVLADAEALLDAATAFGTPVIAIAGNHDAGSPLVARLRPRRAVRWLSAAAPESVELTGAGVTVHGQSVASPQEARDLAASYPPPVAGSVNLGLLHTSLDGTTSRHPCAPTTLETLRGRGYDGWLLGHVHDRRVLSAEPLIAFIGSDAPHRASDDATYGYATLDLAPGDLRLTYHDL